MYHIKAIKWLVVFLLSLAIKALTAQSFQATMTSQNTTLSVKIKATGGNLTTGFANMEFYIRYPSSTTIAWGTPVANTTDFPSIAIQKNDPYTSVTESGFTIVRFFLLPGTFTTSKIYTNGTEYEVFRVSATGTGSANIEMMHKDAENPYVLTLVNEFATIDWAGSVKFYGMGASGAGAIQSLPLSIVLPLELIHFTATAENKNALLNWKTADEYNVSHFDIERSTEAKFWTKIGIQKAEYRDTKSSNNEGNYIFTDEKAFEISKAPFYRLKMVDNDGQFSYSPIRQVTTDKINSLKIYPNPTHESLTVEGFEAHEEGQVIDVLGKVRTTFKGSQVLDLTHYTEGVYFIRKANGQTLQFIVHL